MSKTFLSAFYSYIDDSKFLKIQGQNNGEIEIFNKRDEINCIHSCPQSLT